MVPHLIDYTRGPSAKLFSDFIPSERLYVRDTAGDSRSAKARSGFVGGSFRSLYQVSYEFDRVQGLLFRIQADRANVSKHYFQ